MVTSRIALLPAACISAAARCLLAAALAVSASLADEVPSIKVTRGALARIPVAVVPFAFEGAGAAENLPAAIIEANLARSGRFDPLARENFIDRPQELEAVRYKIWQLLEVENLVIGRLRELEDHRIEIQFRLLDVYRERQLAGQKFTVPAAQLRKTAHQISDIIHEKLLGRRGAFDTRIAYVTVDDKSRRYRLQIADSDGHAPKTILESAQPILSPAWSPDGGRLAYVSFEQNRSMVYVQDLWSGRRERIAGYDGINSAPAWSPDGARLALTLSKEGNPEIYIYEIRGGGLRRLTRHTAIDTEPAWSPDGAAIAFTSNRSGTPQIYRIAASGGAARRVTFDGKYNAGASFSGDGKSIVLITNQGNGYRVALYSAAERSVRELTRGRHDESPTLAPNDDMIMYASQSGGRGVLAALSLDGRVRQIIRTRAGEVREVDWSPYERQ
ncbi:MAG: Tol-Pal system beta propeller repeat protein TolB [Gammaproteobacteria bacterium]